MISVYSYRNSLSTNPSKTDRDIYSLLVSEIIKPNRWHKTKPNIIDFSIQTNDDYLKVNAHITELLQNTTACIVIDLRFCYRSMHFKHIVSCLLSLATSRKYRILVWVDDIEGVAPEYFSSKEVIFIDRIGRYRTDAVICSMKNTKYYQLIEDGLINHIDMLRIVNFTHFSKDRTDLSQKCYAMSFDLSHCIQSLVYVLFLRILSKVKYQIQNVDLDVLVYPEKAVYYLRDIVTRVAALLSIHQPNKEIISYSDNEINLNHIKLGGKKVLVVTDLVDSMNTIRASLKIIAEAKSDFSNRTVALISLLRSQNCKSTSIRSIGIDFLFDVDIIKFKVGECMLCSFGYRFADNQYDKYPFNSYFFWWLDKHFSKNNKEVYFNPLRRKLQYSPDYVEWFVKLGPFFVLQFEDVCQQIKLDYLNSATIVYPYEVSGIKKVNDSVSGLMVKNLHNINLTSFIPVPRKLLTEIIKSQFQITPHATQMFTTTIALLEGTNEKEAIIVDECVVHGDTLKALLVLLSEYDFQVKLVYSIVNYNPTLINDLKQRYSLTQFVSLYEFQLRGV